MQTYIFEGKVTAVEPLTVTLKGAQSALGHRLPRNGGFRARPYFPATSLRGALRHAGHVSLVNNLAKTKNEKFSLADHFMLAQGTDIKGVAEQFDGGKIDATVALRQKNPFISIWGRWGVDGRVSIGNLIPITEDCFADFGGGARTIMFERNDALIQAISAAEVDELNHIIKEQGEVSEDMKPIKAEIQSLTKSLKQLGDGEAKERVKEKISVLEQQIADIKGSKTGAKEAIRRPIDTYEAFVAGCEFDHRMKLESATETELSLFLASFQMFARDSRLGGHTAHNCGEIKGSYTVKVWPEDADAPVRVGKMEWDENGFRVEGQLLTRVLNAWKTAEGIDFKKW
jgi:CRISPR type IV-associated protein Csf2